MGEAKRGSLARSPWGRQKEARSRVRYEARSGLDAHAPRDHLPGVPGCAERVVVLAARRPVRNLVVLVDLLQVFPLNVLVRPAASRARVPEPGQHGPLVRVDDELRAAPIGVVPVRVRNLAREKRVKVLQLLLLGVALEDREV